MSWQFILRVVIKAAGLFIIFNLAFAAINPMPVIQKLSVYNTLIDGRVRFPYGENPPQSYNLTLLDLDALFAAHEISAIDQHSDEYQVFLVGDSSVWGWLLEPDETLSACLNRQHLQTADGRSVRFYDLGYPLLNVTKDLLIIDHALQYQPDMVVWMVTLASLYPVDQLYHEMVRSNPDEVKTLINEYSLALDPTLLPAEPTFWERTLVGQRRELADWLRHQVYGLAWIATDVDHKNPKFFTPRRENLYGGQVLFDGRANTLYDQPHEWQTDDLSLDVLLAGVVRVEDANAEMVVINEPIFQSQGGESDVRYNFYYPRWAYDSYRALMNNLATVSQWQYVDLWDAAPNDQFTDSSLHLTPSGTCQFAATLGAEILRYAE